MSLSHTAAADVGASTTDVAVRSGGWLRGLLRWHGHRFPVEPEVTDDACFRLTLSAWGSEGEIIWRRAWFGTVPADHPCRVGQCQKLPPDAETAPNRTPHPPALARYTWTLQPPGAPFPA